MVTTRTIPASDATEASCALTLTGANTKLQIAYLHYIYGERGPLAHVSQFAAAAETLGHAITVHAMNLAPGPHDPGAAALGLRLRLRNALKTRLSRYLHEPKELAWNALYCSREKRLLQRNRPDVLLVRDHLLTASCVLVASQLRLPLVLELNAPAAESRLYYDEYMHLPWIPEWLERWKLRAADAITVVSSALRDHVVQRYGIPAEIITVAPNGADTSAFSPDTPIDPAVPAVFRNAPVVGFDGSFQKWHGCDHLIALIKNVAAADPSVRFVLVGDGPGAAAIRSAAVHVGDRVLFTGQVSHDRMPGLIAAFDIGVLPESNFYGSPLKVLEWMASGKAVVAPRYGPLEDVIRDGVDGLLFPPRDTAAMVRHVVRLIADRKLRARLSSAAAESVRTAFSWTHNAQRIVAACRSAIDRHRAAAMNDAVALRHSLG